MRPARPSSTALLIARSTVVSSARRGWGGLYDPRAVGFCAQFVRDHMRGGHWRLRLYRTAAYRWLLAWLEERTLPGIQLHYALRKNLIEEWVRAALNDGYRNVRVTGAGFDTLALRLAADYHAVQFEELDHPATQSAKRKSITDLGGGPSNLSLRAVDFQISVRPGALAARSHHQADTVVVAEGLLMYLSAVDVQRFFKNLRREFPARLRVVFTFMVPDAGGLIRFHNSSRLVDAWLDMKGEPFTWGIHPDALGEFLRRQGYELVDVLGHAELERHFSGRVPGGSPHLAQGEWLAVAEAKT